MTTLSQMIEFIGENLTSPIVLVGTGGAGKTTIGDIVANILSLDFIDSDHRIEKTEGASIPQIFEEHGETYFRELERAVIRDLALQVEPCIIGTGGGAFMQHETRELILSRTISIFLKCDIDLLVKRVGDGTGRPLFKDKDPRDVLETMIFSRYPIYAKSDITVQSEDEMAEETAKKVIESLYNYLIAD